MDAPTAATAFDPHAVQQALHALRGWERTPEEGAALGDLEGLAQALAHLGSVASADVTPKHVREIADSSAHDVLKRAARLFWEKPTGHRDLSNALDAQADAIRRLGALDG